jgi:hypothetical protein
VPTAQHVSLQEWSTQPSAWGSGQPSRSAVTAQHVPLQERSAQTSACSGGRPLRPVPTQPTITTVPGSSQSVFNSNPNSGNGYQHTAAWSGSSLPESWPTSQQIYSTSGTHVTGSPNVANNPAEGQFTGRSTSWNPSYPHNTPRSGP